MTLSTSDSTRPADCVAEPDGRPTWPSPLRGERRAQRKCRHAWHEKHPAHLRHLRTCGTCGTCGAGGIRTRRACHIRTRRATRARRPRRIQPTRGALRDQLGVCRLQFGAQSMQFAEAFVLELGEQVERTEVDLATGKESRVGGAEGPEPRRGRFRPGEQGAGGLERWRDGAEQQGEEDLVLTAEVVVHARLADARRRRDGVGARSAVPDGAEEDGAGVQDVLPRAEPGGRLACDARSACRFFHDASVYRAH